MNRILRKAWFILPLFIVGMVLNTEAQTFECDSKLYQVINGKDLKVLDPATGTYQLVGTSSITYNGAGFNSEDNYIYGIGSGNVLVKVDNTGEATNLGTINDLNALAYSADIDTLGNWFSFNQIGSRWILNSIDLSQLPPVVKELEVTELEGVANASRTNDITFNPVTKKYYGMNAARIMEFDPYNLTVKTIADYSGIAESGGYGAAWADAQGNTYFFHNSTGNIYRCVFDTNGDITSFAFIASSEPNGNNDGMSCSLAAPPTFPEVCGNGIDDDLDGLTDCEDPDCYTKYDCGVAAEAVSTDVVCNESLASFHTFYTNNSNLANTITIGGTLPEGFIFLQDTLEFDQGGISTFIKQPVEGDRGYIEWGTITIGAKETLRLSFDVSFDENITNGVSLTTFEATLATQGSQLFPATVERTTTINSCPEPVAYSCDPAFYQVYKKKGKRQPNMYGKLNAETGDYDPIAVASDYANGLGFDVNTGLVYGASGKRFIQLDADGLVLDKSIRFNNNVYRGDINASSEWFGVDGNDMVKIDVSGTPSVEAVYTGQGLKGWDISYNQDGHFYALDKTTLQRFNTTTLQKETVGTISGLGVPSTGGYGAQWTGDDGYLYASHNSSGIILRIDVVTLQARVVSTSIEGLSKNDGFSCPSSIPAVYEFDYSDNSNLAKSRILTYKQDLKSDDIPDYVTVWLGNTISYDNEDPSNVTADGDNDDGFDLSTEIQDDQLSYAMGLNSNQAMDAHILIGLDWDNDGAFDEYISKTQAIEGSTTDLGNINVPAGYESGTLNVRVIVSESALSASNIEGDLLQMGEVEDYIYNLTTACDTCEVSSANLGGLESNGALATAIATRNFKRSVKKEHKELKRNQLEMSYYMTTSNSRTSGAADVYFPNSGIRGTEEVTISTPEDLIGITNAERVVSADYYQNERRVAAALLMETNGSVYNHSKNVCDRLNDKSINDIQVMNLDGYKLVTAKIVDQNGVVEYSTWFGLRQDANGHTLESLWNVDMYPAGNYLNFQVWGSSLAQIYHIAREIIGNVGDVKVNTSLHHLPEVFVKEGRYEQGKLYLTVVNKSEAQSLTIEYNKRETEQSEEEAILTDIALTGESLQEVVLDAGYLFDAGISIRTSATEAFDALYLADGAWGTDFNPALSAISHFNILPVEELAEEGYMIARGFELDATSSDVVNVFRNVLAGEKSLNINEFSTISFSMESNVPLEVVLVDNSLENWEDRMSISVPAQHNEKKVTLRLSDFANFDASQAYDLQSLVFSYLNQSGLTESVSITMTNVVLGNEKIILAASDEAFGFDYSVFPNPIQDVSKVKLFSQENQAYSMTVINLAGSEVKSTNGRLNMGSNEFDIQKANIKGGVYFLRLQMEDGSTKTKKVIFKD